MAQPTLEELAQAQVNNPDNPYAVGPPQNAAYNPFGDNSAGSQADPRDVALAQKELDHPSSPAPIKAGMSVGEAWDARSGKDPNAPASQGFIAYDEQGKPYVAHTDSDGKTVTGGTLPQTTPAGLGSSDNPNHPSRMDAMPANGSAAKVPGAVLVGGGGIGGPSPGKTLLDAQNKASDIEEGAAQADKRTVDEQTKILNQGLELGKSQAQIGGAIDQANVAQQKLVQQKMDIMSKQRTAELEQEAAEARAAKVDPGHWFKQAGVAGSILAAISIAGGAFAAAMPRTNSNTNFALKIVSDSIDRDVNAQQDNIANKWKSVSLKVGQNDRADAKDNYMMAQMRDARAIDWSHTRALVEDAIANSKSQSTIVGLQAFKAQADREIGKITEARGLHAATYIQGQQALAQAASARTNVSPKEKLAMIGNLVDKGYSEADALAAVDFRISGGKKGGSPTPPTKLTGDTGKAGQEAIKSMDDIYEPLKGTNTGTILGSNPIAQRISPSAAQKAAGYEAAPGQLRAALRSAGDREEDKSIDKKMEPYYPNKFDSDEMLAWKQRESKKLITRTMAESVEKKKGPSAEDK